LSYGRINFKKDSTSCTIPVLYYRTRRCNRYYVVVEFLLIVLSHVSTHDDHHCSDSTNRVVLAMFRAL